MAFKIIKATSLALMALLDSSISSSLVNAVYTSSSQGVLRVDLQRKEIPHDTLQMSDTVDVDKMLQFD